VVTKKAGLLLASISTEVRYGGIERLSDSNIKACRLLLLTTYQSCSSSFI